MRYFLELAYKGTAYNGWQRQNNAPSVQQEVERALSVLLREEIEVVGAGRTDTGVHAEYYVVHFDANTTDELNEDFCYHLNSVLPSDIAAKAIRRVADDAHARFDAVEREYKYYITIEKNPFNRELTWQYYVPLDMEAMNTAAAALLSNSDFTAFSKLHSNNKTNICKVSFAGWELKESMMIFTIRSDRFLRNMVRSIVGTLVDVGRGKITVEQFVEIMNSLDRSRACSSAPSQGLFLTNVKYKLAD